MDTTKILEKFKAIFNIDAIIRINNRIEIKNINIATKEDLTIIKKSGNKLLLDNDANPLAGYEEQKNKLHLFPEALDSEKRKEYDKIIRDNVSEGGRILWEETINTLNKLDAYYKNQEEDSKILSFYKGVIPDEDLEALEASLFLRKCFFRKDPSVAKLKAGIVKKFGERGKNIANLCTPGYFEHFLKELYETENKDKFNELYNLAVTGKLFVYVHSDMKEKDIEREIDLKLRICKKYGVGFLDIHAVSRVNVCTLKKLVDEKKEFFTLFEKRIYESPKGDLIIVRLLL